MSGDTYHQACIDNKRKCIVDSDGNRVEFGDPRVVHVWPMGLVGHETEFLSQTYAKRGLNFRVCCEVGPQVLKNGKKICTGRECVPFVVIAGNVYKDLTENRQRDEITLYYAVDQIGPCQMGGWPIIFDAYAERAKLRNVIFMVRLRSKDNYLGQGQGFARDHVTAYALAGIVDEAESSLRILAANPQDALSLFKEATQTLYRASQKGLPEIQLSLEQWAKRIKRIPLAKKMEDVPKVLVFGGLNVQIAYVPIRRYFEEQGMITKVIELTESILWQSSEGLVRYNFDQGRTSVDEQYELLPYISMFARAQLRKILGGKRRSPKEGQELVALSSRMTMHYVESLVQKLRRKAAISGLLYDEFVPYSELLREGDRHINNVSFTESTAVIGRYLHTNRRRLFDGMVNIGSFSCQPSQNTLSIIRGLGIHQEMPFVSLDCDGDELNVTQQRLVENLYVQATRYHRNKMSKTRAFAAPWKR